MNYNLGDKIILLTNVNGFLTKNEITRITHIDRERRQIWVWNPKCQKGEEEHHRFLWFKSNVLGNEYFDTQFRVIESSQEEKQNFENWIEE